MCVSEEKVYGYRQYGGILLGEGHMAARVGLKIS